MVGKSKTATKTSPDPVDSLSKRKKSPGRPKSPARAKSPGRKSPARTSPARTKSESTKSGSEAPRTSTRTRSPARLRNATPPSTSKATPVLTPSRRSPIRRSPARTVKDFSEDFEKEIPVILTRKQKIVVDTDTDSDNADSILEKIEKPKAMVRGRSRKKEDVDNKGDVKTVDTDKDTNSFGVVQRFTRASQNREIERVVHLKHFDSVTVTKRLGEFSDEDDLVQKSQAEIQEFTDTKKLSEFGGSYGALFFMITFPVYVVALNIFCNEEQCSFTKLPNLQKFKSVSSFFNATSLLLLLAYVTLLAILTALPFGGTKVPALPNKHGKFYYVNNGFFSFVILTLIICGLEWRNISISTFIIDHILHLAVSSVLFGFVISVYAYIRSFYVPVSALNAHVVGKSGIYGFFLGREVNPRLFSIIDLKMMFFKGCVLAAVFIDYAYLYNSIKNTVTEKESENYPFIKLISSHPTLFTYTLLHSVHILEALVFESRWITTFEIEQEAFGFMLAMGYTVYPFITALIPKYLVNHGVELASWKLVADAVAFFLGYALYRLSNNQKDAFRKNPYSPSLSHLGTIPTMQGKKLLVSGFWGFVRHPNYLGDIMMHLCYIPFVGLTPPIVYPLCMILMLVHRSVRDNARCKLKYGAAWDRYCNRVKYVLIPKIY